jgi:type II secretory pathway predicted ATPase ExeA
MATMGLLKTKAFLLVEERVEEALDGINAVIYGPSSSEKSYLLEHISAQFRAAGRPVVYAYCGPRTTETFLYRIIAEAAGIPVRSSLRWACRYAVLAHLRSQPKLPAIILDEAQHLEIDALEGARQIHDLTRREDRPGVGIILAGSHGLLHFFTHPQRRLRLEQLLSRFPFRVQLEGMSEKEILTLGASAFGNGKPASLSDKHKKLLLENCAVTDLYFIGADGKAAPRTYYSSRRLLEFIRQQRKGLKVVRAEGVS